MEPVLLSRDGRIVTVILNNPAKLNALTLAMWQRLGEAMRELSSDGALRCIVLRGAGDQAFAGGADISEVAIECSNSTQARRYGKLIHEAMQAVARCRHPTVALIKGACVGGGLEIAAVCDMRVCGESGRFGVPVNQLGLTLSYVELQAVLALAGRATTLELLLEGKVFGAREALQKGLVNCVLPDDRVEAAAYACAARIADGAPLVARWHKQFIERLAVKPGLTAAEQDESYGCFDTEDYRIGMDAFLKKGKPVFKGR